MFTYSTMGLIGLLMTYGIIHNREQTIWWAICVWLCWGIGKVMVGSY